ncbi:MAG: hypothetical protein ICV55_09415 [Coleofasciculus sp. C3-bin4]|nr:hypothetical protein [Coleofasciculus sp. C3-bin4]
MPGKHLEPIGIKIGNYIVDFNPFDKFIEPIEARRLEDSVIQFLEQLKQRSEQQGSRSQTQDEAVSEAIPAGAIAPQREKPLAAT